MDLLNTTYDCSKYGNAKSGGMYVKYFIAFDVRSVHILRVQENLNEDYEPEEGCNLIEHEQIDYYPALIDYFEEKYGFTYKGDDRLFPQKMIAKYKIVEVLKTIADYDEENGYENYDYKCSYDSIDEIVQSDILQDGMDNLSTTTI